MFHINFYESPFLLISFFIETSYIAFANFFFFFLFNFKLYKKDKESILILEFLKKKRNFWEYLKIISLSIFLLIPHRIYIFNGLTLPGILFITFIIILLGNTVHVGFIFLYAINLLFAFSCFIFAAFYTKSPFFKNLVNKIYFNNNSSESNLVFNYFLGNMLKNTMKFFGGAFTGGTVYFYKKEHESVLAQHEAERRVRSCMETSTNNSAYTPHDIMELTQTTKREILRNESTVHMLENKVLNSITPQSFDQKVSLPENEPPTLHSTLELFDFYTYLFFSIDIAIKFLLIFIILYVLYISIFKK